MAAFDDPTTIEVIAVTVEDLLGALAGNVQREADAVLRVTPPFHARMRARLHLAGGDGSYDDPVPIHIPPATFLETVPAFPSVDGTEDAVRGDLDRTYTPATHKAAHEATIDTWRDAVRAAVRDRITIETAGGGHAVSVATLG